MSVIVLGRFPPPIDGQSLLTEHVAALLDGAYDVRRIDTQPRDDVARHQHGVSLRRLVHFAALRLLLAKALPKDAGSTILWPAVSPDVAGHLRDRFAVLPALRPYGNVFAVVHRGNFDKLFRSSLTRASARRMVRRLTGFVFNTEGLSRRCSQWIPAEKRFIIPNTIDEALLFSEEEIADKQRLRLERRTTRLLYLSNMIRSKGYLDVLEAARLLKERGTEIEVQFVGAWMNESDRTDFDGRISQAGLAPVVKHLGPIRDRRRIKEVYGRSDVLILPTYYPNEAQPLVVIEALNAGVPIVATRHASIPEMVTDGRESILVPPREPTAISEAVLQMANSDRWLQLSRAARSRFNEYYSPKRVRMHWEELVSMRDAETPSSTGTKQNNR